MLRLEDVHFIDRQFVEVQPLDVEGFILDIGGGGEGIIGQLNGRQVVAIDKRLEELEETENEALKIVMDATDLKFLPETLDAATFFFTLMYVPMEDCGKVLEEAHGALKTGASLHIWDLRIPERFNEKTIYGAHFTVKLPTKTVDTGYGAKWERKTQDLEYFRELGEEAGFRVSESWERDEVFYLELVKGS